MPNTNTNTNTNDQRDQMDQEPGGQGRVKDPAHDGRLRENGGGQTNRGNADDGRGRVKDPETDGRLKANRGGSNQSDQGQSNASGDDGQSDGIQHITRLTIQGITYEATQSDTTGPSLRVVLDEHVQDGGQNIDTELSEQDVQNIVSFFTQFQRESRRNQRRLQSARNVNDNYDNNSQQQDDQRDERRVANSR